MKRMGVKRSGCAGMGTASTSLILPGRVTILIFRRTALFRRKRPVFGSRVKVSTSPFLRTIETAHHIAEALDLPIKIEHGASEWLNPDWFSARPVHIPLDALGQRFPRLDQKYTSVVMPGYPEGGEEAFARAGEASRILADTFSGDLLIIGHGHSVTGMAKGFVGASYQISCGLCALVKVVRQEGRSTLELNGDVSHLSGGEKHHGQFTREPLEQTDMDAV
jgi:broad specificity phosphatase PhoE